MNNYKPGGHTGEMLKLLQGVDLSTYSPLEFIVADNDSMSIEKAKQFIDSRPSQKSKKEIVYNINKIKRSRKVGQSYLSSIFTTIAAFFSAFPLVFNLKPEVLLLNGPGTCLPICFILFVFSRILCILPRARIVFVESICRVKSLSLTGKLFYHLRVVDDFIVQWPELKQAYPRSVYLGRLV